MTEKTTLKHHITSEDIKILNKIWDIIVKEDILTNSSCVKFIETSESDGQNQLRKSLKRVKFDKGIIKTKGYDIFVDLLLNDDMTVATMSVYSLGKFHYDFVLENCHELNDCICEYVKNNEDKIIGNFESTCTHLPFTEKEIYQEIRLD